MSGSLLHSVSISDDKAYTAVIWDGDQRGMTSFTLTLKPSGRTSGAVTACRARRWTSDLCGE
ncbi:hypothetical protein [Paraburkholderia aspalathi]|uniref:hypothetical protein n=1 Tax=Paraburkholderia aspalathi TaxID=1324617 RepID=UPI002467F5F0|nr:hypothetical protein [Paraburkholderia aspalathi]